MSDVMCLGLPMKVLSCHDTHAVCSASGVERDVSLLLIDARQVAVGDYLIVHLGFAIERIDPQAAKQAQSTWEEWRQFEATERQGDA